MDNFWEEILRRKGKDFPVGIDIIYDEHFSGDSVFFLVSCYRVSEHQNCIFHKLATKNDANSGSGASGCPLEFYCKSPVKETAKSAVRNTGYFEQPPNPSDDSQLGSWSENEFSLVKLKLLQCPVRILRWRCCDKVDSIMDFPISHPLNSKKSKN